MRKARGPLWWYRLRYEAPKWLLPALVLVGIIIAYQVGQLYNYAATTPVCRKVADAPKGMEAGKLAPDGRSRWQRVSRCRDGYVDVSGHEAR